RPAVGRGAPARRVRRRVQRPEAAVVLGVEERRGGGGGGGGGGRRAARRGGGGRGGGAGDRLPGVGWRGGGGRPGAGVGGGDGGEEDGRRLALRVQEREVVRRVDGEARERVDRLRDGVARLEQVAHDDRDPEPRAARRAPAEGQRDREARVVDAVQQ